MDTMTYGKCQNMMMSCLVVDYSLTALVCYQRLGVQNIAASIKAASSSMISINYTNHTYVMELGVAARNRA